MIEPPAKPVTPLVSILVNNYNYGHFVVEAAASALSQTWSRIEVIVVDDGSTDDSLQRLQAIDDPRLQVIAQPNGGQGAAYNTGFERSRGEFVIFLDADDTLERTVVERALVAFEPGVSKVQFALDVIDRRGQATARCHPPEIQHDGCRESVALFGAYASPPGTGNVYSRDFLTRVMPIVPAEQFASGADAWPILMAPFFGRIVSLKGTGGRYRVHRDAEPGQPLVIGNINADPHRCIERTQHSANLVIDALAANGVAGVGAPTLPAPSLLKAWTLARISDPLLAPSRVYGRRLSAMTVLQSVLQWSPYRPRKKIAYIGWLALLGLTPPAVSRLLFRALGRKGWV